MRSALGFPAADDPAYAHEFEELAQSCRKFLAALDADDFDNCMFSAGLITASCATIYRLSPPAGLFDLAELFTNRKVEE